tara:strand:- start:261 stop:2240 length:1980 start_codon:yes stop_codon:yes gene_type:complete
MASTRQTYPIEFKGGLVTNMSPLQQGTNAPGTARVLKNFEPSVEGGYRRILGYSKYNSSIIPPYGAPVVHGSGQNSTTLIVGNINQTPVAGDTFTVAGVTGTYTIASGGVSFDATNNRATLTINSLASAPANAAAVTFTSTTSKYLMLGCNVFLDRVIVAKNDDLYKVTSSTVEHISVPNYGTVLVNGASQTGTSLIVDGLTSAPQAGDVFKIAGVNLVYTITTDASLTNDDATLAINPALATSPAENAVITFLSTSRDGAAKTRFARYNFTGTEKVAIVDSANAPALYDNNTFTVLNAAPADVVSAEFVTAFKNQLFFAKDTLLTFTSPYTDNDFSAALGAGTISVGASITGIIVFREELIVFTESSILRVTGNTISDFQLQPITSDIGCVDTDTIQEVGGDVIFLGPDGLRLLSATDRIGDFGLAVVSKVIQKETTNFITASTSFASVVIRGKSQYRIIGYNTNITQENAQGIIGTQFSGQGGEGMAWGELRGIRAYVAASRFYQNAETIVFANDDGYLYQMEDGNSFDGSNIQTTFSTPYIPISDPRIRKTFYKAYLYTDPQGSVSFDMSLKLDFDQLNSIQPIQINFDNNTGEVAFYGSAVFGSAAIYSNKLVTLFETQLVGSGFTASIQFESDSTDPPFSLDAITLEYGTNTRR